MDRKTEEYEEEQGEDFIDLEDISIYENDPNYEPSEEEVVYYAERLGFDVENDPKEFLTIAYQALKAPLPENWRRALVKSKDELVYINLEDQTIHLFTDIDEMAYKYYIEEKEKWMKGKQEKESRPKVIPRGKIPPINAEKGKDETETKKKKKKDTGQKDEIQSKESPNRPKGEKKPNKEKSQSPPNKKPQQKQEKPNQIMEINSLNVKNTDKEKELKSDLTPTGIKNLYTNPNLINSVNNKNVISTQDKDPYNFSTKYDKYDQIETNQPQTAKTEKMNINIHKTLESEKDEFEVSNDPIHTIPDDADISSTDLNNIKMEVNENKEHRITQISELPEENEYRDNVHNLKKESFETGNSPSPNIKIVEAPQSNKHLNLLSLKSEREDIEQSKREYFNSKLKEMKDFETQIREEYNKQVEDYKQRKNQIKMGFSEEYERKIALNKRKMRDEFEKNNDNEIKKFERELEENLENSEKEYLRELEQNSSFNKLNDVPSEPQNNLKLLELEKEKENLLQEIKFSSELKEKQIRSLLDSELADAKLLLEEKFEIEKKNLDRKYDLYESEMETDEEIKFNKELETLQKQSEFNIEDQEKSLRTSHSKLLEEYQKALDEDFTIQTKTILREMEEKQKKEISQYKISLEKQKEEKSSLFKKEILSLEKEYYSEINKNREENRNQSQLNDKKVNTKFENVLNTYELLKKKINIKSDSVCQEIIKNLKLIIESQELEEDYLSIEAKFEEYILSLIDDSLISLQRKKASYEVLEVEYKEKSLLLDYYVEVGTQLVRCLKDNPTKKIDKENRNIIKVNQIEEKIYENIISHVKEKQNEFRVKNLQMKEQKLFDICSPFSIQSNHPMNATSPHMSSSNVVQNKNQFNSNSLLISQNNMRNSINIDNTNLQNMSSLNNTMMNQNPLNNTMNNTMMHNKSVLNPYNNHNKSVNINNVSNLNNYPSPSFHQTNIQKVPLSSGRYSNENIIYYDQKEKIDKFREDQFKDLKERQNTNNSNPNSYSQNPFHLTQEIIEKLDLNEKNIIQVLNDFLFIESDRLQKEYLNLINHKKIYENLKITIDEVNTNGNGSNQNLNNSLIGYYLIVEEDKDKIKLEERNYTYQKNIFEQIESLIEDCYIYIRNNINFENKKDIISDKLKMVQRSVDDYYEAYSELKQSKRNFNSGLGSDCSTLNKSIHGKESNTSQMKMGNSTDLFTSQKMNREKSSIYNSDNSNNTFNNFYTLYSRKSLHDNLLL
jgi:hypothetical protein